MAARPSVKKPLPGLHTPVCTTRLHTRGTPSSLEGHGPVHSGLLLTSQRPLSRTVTSGASAQELWGDPVQVTAVPWAPEVVTCHPRVSVCSSTAGTPPSVTTVSLASLGKTVGCLQCRLRSSPGTHFPSLAPKPLCCWFVSFRGSEGPISLSCSMPFRGTRTAGLQPWGMCAYVCVHVCVHACVSWGLVSPMCASVCMFAVSHGGACVGLGMCVRVRVHRRTKRPSPPQSGLDASFTCSWAHTCLSLPLTCG